MKLYLSGPMTWHRDFNFPAFDRAAARLRADGHEVCNPAERDRERYGSEIFVSPDGDPAKLAGFGFSLREAFAEDLKYICLEAEGIAVLPGWEGSKGAMAEFKTARALELPVIYL